MRRNIIIAAALVLAACSSTQPKANLPQPEIAIWQTSEVPSAARFVEGNVPVYYRMRVANRAAEAITLKSVTVRSVAQGAYNVNPTSRPFDQRIEPEAVAEIEFWVPAFIEYASMVGANGPVTLRVDAQFDSPAGRFQASDIHQVNAFTGVDGRNQ